MVLNSMPLDELVYIYNFFDVGLCTYSKGSTVSMPTKFFDNLGAGLVTITSLEGEISKLIEKHKIGLRYEGGNHLSLYNAILELSNNKKLLLELKENIKSISSKFSCDEQYKIFADFVDNTLS